MVHYPNTSYQSFQLPLLSKAAAEQVAKTSSGAEAIHIDTVYNMFKKDKAAKWDLDKLKSISR